MKEIFQKAWQEKYAVGAFNVSNLEQLKSIIQAAQKLQAPVIVATSEGESKFIGKKQMVALVKAWREETRLPLVLHLDHGKSFEVIKEAVEAGYDSVHFDGSGLSLEENIERTRQVVDWIREYETRNVHCSHTAKYKIQIEGELGYLRGKSTFHEKIEIKEEDLTDPDQALKFIEETGVDSLAVAIGNIHGLSAQVPQLHFERLAQIRNKAEIPLVLHGGSGIPSDQIKKAIELGITKINVNTELRVAYTQALKKNLQDNPQETTPYKIMPPVIEAVQKVVEEKIKLFGSSHKL
jgi:ketose-bisphosphate aldolase